MRPSIHPCDVTKSVRGSVFDQSFVRFACNAEPSGSKNWLFKDLEGYKSQKAVYALKTSNASNNGYILFDALVVKGIGPCGLGRERELDLNYREPTLPRPSSSDMFLDFSTQ